MNKTIRALSIAAAIVVVAGSASAQSTAANQQRCQQLSAEIQKSFQNAVQARVPKQDPSSFNQESFDIKGILSQDVASGLGKLMNLDFSGIIDKVVQKGIDKATQKATSTFNNKINGVLQNAGVSNVNTGAFNIDPNSVGGYVSGTVSGTATGQSATAGAYGRK